MTDIEADARVTNEQQRQKMIIVQICPSPQTTANLNSEELRCHHWEEWNPKFG